MRGRLMFLGGVAIGYVLGSRAGRERYDQIVRTAHKAWESPTVQETAGVVQAQATKLYDQSKQVVNERLHSMGGRGRESGPEMAEADAEWDSQARQSQSTASTF